MSRGVFKSLSSFTLAAIALAAFGAPVNAADLTWGGIYRVEGVKINGAELSSPQSDKSYVLHHLILNPKIVAADGLMIFGRLDVLNDQNFGVDANGRVYSVAGDVLGNGPNASPATATNPARGTDSNSYSRSMRASPIQVTSLYGTWTHEFGQLIIGRTPVQFGLGTAYSAGNGSFDHFIDTKDLVAYKMQLGNLFILPILGKMSEGNLSQEDDVDDYILHVQYDNPESELSLGVLYQIRVVTGNDSPLSGTLGGAGATRTGSYKNTLMSLFFSQKAGKAFRTGFEADLVSGDSGIQTAAGAGVGLNAFGIAGELAWVPTDSKWSGVLKAGVASGDDPGTNDVYEGYHFNRNYNVGMLLFNHPLGQRDFLRTDLVRDTTTRASSQIDTEALSNVIYAAPSLTYRVRDNLSYGGAVVYGMLNKDPIGANSGTGKNLGFELDLNVTYKPFERMTWITEAGFLLPGDAWKAGTAQLENKMAYGFITKAAINF